MIDDTLFTPSSYRLRRDVDDQATIRLVQSGHVEAVGLLFERYSRLVMSVATRILRDYAEAQDLLQDVFVYVLRRGRMFDPARGTVASWLLQVTYSKSLNRRKQRLARCSVERVAIDVATQIADPDMCPDRTTERLSAGKVVRPALAELTNPQRETLCLYFFEGYSLLQISRKRNESLGNTRHHFYRGMAALRVLLKSSDERPLVQQKRSASRFVPDSVDSTNAVDSLTGS
jgi:RNA polymerase sigma-70 factor, ECF subfamily